MAVFNLVKVFSATTSEKRSSLGDRVAEWLESRPDVNVVDVATVQSSDARFHCLTITLFCSQET